MCSPSQPPLLQPSLPSQQQQNVLTPQQACRHWLLPHPQQRLWHSMTPTRSPSQRPLPQPLQQQQNALTP